MKQREDISHFAEAKDVHIDKWVSEITRKRVTPRERYIDQLNRRMKEGDILVVSDISRLGMSIGDVMKHLTNFLKKRIGIYCVYDRYVFDHTLNITAMLRAFELLGEIESTLVTTRTKDALDARKLAGVKLGRPKGSNSKQSLLSEHKEEIMQMLERGESVNKICSYFGVTGETYYRFKRSSDL